ncbi:MAG: hypothetical protein ACRCZI_10070 [Cetobacterium sp.]
MRCTKCFGLFIERVDETYCINCGYRLGCALPQVNATPVVSIEPWLRRVRAQAADVICTCGKRKLSWQERCWRCVRRAARPLGLDKIDEVC